MKCNTRWTSLYSTIRFSLFTSDLRAKNSSVSQIIFVFPLSRKKENNEKWENGLKFLCSSGLSLKIMNSSEQFICLSNEYSFICLLLEVRLKVVQNICLILLFDIYFSENVSQNLSFLVQWVNNGLFDMLFLW